MRSSDSPIDGIFRSKSMVCRRRCLNLCGKGKACIHRHFTRNGQAQWLSCKRTSRCVSGCLIWKSSGLVNLRAALCWRSLVGIRASAWDQHARCDSTAFKMHLFPQCANTRSRLSSRPDVIVSFLLFLAFCRRQRLFHLHREWHVGRNQSAR